MELSYKIKFPQVESIDAVVKAKKGIPNLGGIIISGNSEAAETVSYISGTKLSIISV